MCLCVSVHVCANVCAHFDQFPVPGIQFWEKTHTPAFKVFTFVGTYCNTLHLKHSIL